MHVRIFKPSAPVDKGTGFKDGLWRIEPVSGSFLTREPLMGWFAAGDALSSLRRALRFPSREAALAFAAAQGWTCELEDPVRRHPRPRSFMDNFRLLRPEDEEREAAAFARQ